MSTYRRACGYTLIEALIALLILAIGLLGIAGLYVSSLRGDALSRDLEFVSRVALEELDMLNASSYASLASDSKRVTHRGSKYNVVWTVTDKTPGPDTKQIVMQVGWPTDDPASCLDPAQVTTCANLQTYVSYVAKKPGE